MDFRIIGMIDDGGEFIATKRIRRPKAPKSLSNRAIEEIARSIEGNDHLGTNVSARGESW